MLWILRQGNQVTRFEIRHHPSAMGYQLVVTYPDGRVVSEEVEESIDLLARTVAVLKKLREEGWVADAVPIPAGSKVTAKPRDPGDPVVH